MRQIYITKTRHSIVIERIKIILGLLLYRVSLDYLYSKVIYKYYYMYGFNLDIDHTKVMISYISLIIIGLVFTTQIKKSTPSATILLILFLLAFVPNTSLYSMMNLDHIFMVISICYWGFIVIAYRIIKKLKFDKLKNNIHISNNMYMNIANVLLITILLFSYSYNGMRINISLADVYDMRMESRRLGIPGIMNYLLPWAGNVVFPLVIVDSLRKKKFATAIIFLFAELILFSISGMKTWLFVLILSVAWILFIKKDNFIFKLPLFFSIFNVIAYIEILLFKSSFLVNYIIRRVFYSTSLSNWYYIDFFKNNEKLYLIDSALGWTKRFGFSSPHGNESISRIIGRVYYNNLEMNASSGTIADAFSNFGWMGVILYPLLLVFVLKLLDYCSSGVNSSVLIPIYFSMSIYLLNGNIFSVLTTYGFIFALIYVFIMAHSRENIVTRRLT